MSKTLEEQNSYIEAKLTEWRGKTIADHDHFIAELRETLTLTWEAAQNERKRISNSGRIMFQEGWNAALKAVEDGVPTAGVTIENRDGTEMILIDRTEVLSLLEKLRKH